MAITVYHLANFAFFSLVTATLIFASLVSALLFDVCSNDSDCPDPNQQCEKMLYAKPPCSMGICQCKPCHIIDIDGCQKVKYLNSLDEACDPVRKSEIISIPRAFCKNGRVTCYHAERRGNSCYAIRNCTQSVPCSPGMTCREGRCTCAEEWQRFDATSQTCVERRYGDTCTRDEDCAVKSRINRHWSNLMTCDDGKCNCKTGTKPSQWSGIDPDRNVYVTMTTCFKETIKTFLFNGSCFNNPISDNYDDRTVTCAPGFTCVICPETSSLWGECRLINHAEVISAEKCGRALSSSQTASKSTRLLASSFYHHSSVVLLLLLLLLLLVEQRI